ncbi:uncharacterized protein LOC118163316 [Oxyura jamaicensis]|uniref:uncharacterized protein LOC118163316 n=1 Tax=Oxyura jamaicensis TaxID=8884 RepID=UPI0015A59730|nr:uncharacterized protein LOC118163316 [Oxyura jamaicensis]
MFHQDHARDLPVLAEADSQSQQHDRSQPDRSQRGCRQLTSAWKEIAEARATEAYRFTSRAPPTSTHSAGERPLGLFLIHAVTESGKAVQLLAGLDNYRVQRESPQCWVRDCTEQACSTNHASGRHLSQQNFPDEEDGVSSSISEEFFSMDEGCDDSGTASSQADVTSDDAITSFAKEYSLVPLNRQKEFSAQIFDQQVESYFEGL